MGTRFRRSFKVAPGVRVNLNKKSASISFGPKGLKHTVSTTGKSHTTVGISGRVFLCCEVVDQRASAALTACWTAL